MLESALVLTPPEKIHNRTLQVPDGSLTPVGDVLETFNWEIVAARDKELAYRDVALGSKMAVIIVETEEIFGARQPRPQWTVPIGREIGGDSILTVSSTGSLSQLNPLSELLDIYDVDEQLFNRDVIIHDSVVRSAAVIESATSGSLKSNKVPSTVWSLGEGTLTDEMVNPILPLSVETFKKPDQSLAEIDNYMAHYAAQLDKTLKNPFASATRILMSVEDRGTRDSEAYVLYQETPSQKIFQADPQLPNRMRIVYDKQLKTLRWVTQSETGDLHIPQAQPFVLRQVTVSGPLPGQTLVFEPALKSDHDSYYWKQKATFLKFNRLDLDTVFYTKDPSQYQLTGQASYKDTVMTRPSVARFALPNDLIAGVYIVSLLIIPDKKIEIAGGSNTLGTGDGGYDGGVDFASSGSTFQWNVALPPGTWIMKVQFTNRMGVAPNEFSMAVGVTGMANRVVGFRFASSGYENGDTAEVSIPVTATGTTQSITLSWNPGPSNTTQLHVTRLVFETTATAPITDMTLKAQAYDEPSDLNAVCGEESAVMSGRRGRPDIIQFALNVETPTTGGHVLDITRVTDGDYVVRISEIHMMQVFNGTYLKNAIGFEAIRARYLQRAIDSVRDSYVKALESEPETFRELLDDGSYQWTSASTENWMNAIESVETRVRKAFRPSRPGDLGRPALVPDGLEFIPETTGSLITGSVKAHYDNALSTPNIRQLQPWMVEIGIYVAEDDFHDHEPISVNIDNVRNRPVIYDSDELTVTASCGDTEIPNSVSVVVPAAAFQSNISVDDANAQALAYWLPLCAAELNCDSMVTYQVAGGDFGVVQGFGTEQIGGVWWSDPWMVDDGFTEGGYTP